MTNFDETEHPRSRDGRFAEKEHTGPEVGLATAWRADDIARDIVARDWGDDTELSDVIARGEFFQVSAAIGLRRGWSAARPGERVSEDAYEHIVGGTKSFALRDDLTPQKVRDMVAVAYCRALAFEDSGDGTTRPTLGSGRLRAADAEVARRSGQREIDNDTAKVLAEDLIQRLPDGIHPVDVPQLAQVAAQPEAFSPGDHEKVDALHAELTSIYPRLQPAQRDRANPLYTWSLNGPDTPAPDAIRTA